MVGASPKGAPKSKEFNDVYFSVDDGLAESEYVFLDGADLPRAWLGREKFVICETGFGTGLNFLAAWKLFEDADDDGADAGARLDFISFEKYPLEAADIARYLEPWAEVFGGRLEMLVKAYPSQLSGAHRLVLNERVSLTLVFDDVNLAIGEMDVEVDAWFLDGFKPSTNPDMWSEIVLENIARLSRVGTTVATFTAVGAVRRGLVAVGFEIEKIAGFGPKRHMLIGRFLARRAV